MQLVLLIGLFTFLTIAVICWMITSIFRNRARIRFMQGMMDRGYSAAEIESILRASGLSRQEGDNTGYGLEAPTSTGTTRPVPPVKQALRH
jgi:hypothetical protein